MDENYKISVMTAYMDGKTIEVAPIGSNSWGSTERPMWNWIDFQYRVKPEKRFVPYETLEELDEAVREHGIILIKKKGGSRSVISSWFLGEMTNKMFVNTSFFSGLSAYEMLSEYTWLDGSPFGKEVAK